jgi:ribosome-binding protein aMBF1 (putative translation factor)
LGRATSPAQIGSEGERQQRTIPRAALAVAFGLQNNLPMRRKSEPKSRSTKRTPRSAGVADIEIGRRIRLRRREKGITQTELAGHLGLTFHQVQKYEKAMSRVGAAQLQQIAEMLGVDISFFYDGDGTETAVESLLVLNSVFSDCCANCP